MSFYWKRNIARWGSYENYRKSDVWRVKRVGALERAEYHCQWDARHTRNLEVHHNRRDVIWGEERPADLTVLCDECHGGGHGKSNGQMTLEDERAFKEKEIGMEVRKAYRLGREEGYEDGLFEGRTQRGLEWNGTPWWRLIDP